MVLLQTWSHRNVGGVDGGGGRGGLHLEVSGCIRRRRSIEELLRERLSILSVTVMSLILFSFSGRGSH